MSWLWSFFGRNVQGKRDVSGGVLFIALLDFCTVKDLRSAFFVTLDVSGVGVCTFFGSSCSVWR